MNSQPESPADQPLERGFQLAGLTIDPLEGVVTGPGGRERLDPKVMDVLVMLAQHTGHVVLREHLLSRLWPNTIVTDDALSRCIYELRRQLSLAGGDERYKAMLQTVPKRGYRLNVGITPVPRTPEVRSSARRKWPVAALAAAVLIAAAAAWWLILGHRQGELPVAPSLAVLPFADMSSEQDQGHISDGISEEILNRLNQARTMRVIARTSSFSFKDESTSVPEIAAKLDVTHVLEGSVRRSGDRVRITARLVEAASNAQLWTGTYNRDLGDLFAVLDEIATSVATALRITLAGPPSRNSAPLSAEAHELFLQGEFFYNRRAPGDIERSVKYYQDALAIEPDYARPWAALAGAYSLLAYSGEMPRDVALAKQGEAARKAIELDPRLAVGYARLSQYYWDTGDRRRGYEIWDTARALDPDDPLILNFTAGLAMRAGDLQAGIEAQRRLVARDPQSASAHANLGMYLQAVEKFDEAKAELGRAQDRNPDFGWEMDLAIARILVLQGRLEEAGAAIADLPDGEPRDHGLTLLYHATRRKAEADAAMKRLAARSAEPVNIRLAESYAFRGMIDQAFRALDGFRQILESDEPSMASQIWSWQLEMRVSPFLKPLQADPRWQPLMVEPV